MTLGADIEHWIDRISSPCAEFNGLSPCPYAKTAKIIALACRDITDARNCLIALDTKSVVLLDIPSHCGDEAETLVREITPHLKSKGLFALISDPNKPVIVGGYRTTQSRHLFIIVQPYDELQKAAAQLEKKGYYDNWDEGTLKRIRGGR